MSLKARFRRIEAGVRWLETEGVFRHIEAKIKLLEMLQEISDRIASDPVAAERWKKELSFLALPPPRVPVIRPVVRPPTPVPAPLPKDEIQSTLPHSEEQPARPRLEECAPAAPAAPPPRPPPPDPAIHPYDPPEHMQIRPVRWRARGSDDYAAAAGGMQGRCLVDYDPLAEDDDP